MKANQREPNRPDPYVGADSSVSELTFKAVVLGVLLSVVLAGANAYLGLLAGMTVSASIPAAVISMALLRLFRNANILENNLVQTGASAGESLAAGVIFTFPALIILGAWNRFDYVQTTLIAAMGGMLGVLFTIPLRRMLVPDPTLKFPEGVATAEVLKAGDKGGKGITSLVGGGVAGALFKLGESGLGLWPQAMEGARFLGGYLLYFGSNLLPSLLAVGYIVGLNVAVLMFAGGVLNWLVAIPVYAVMNPAPEGVTAMDYAWQTWSGKTRYIGVGSMVVGGVWVLIQLGPRLKAGIASGLAAWKLSGQGRGLEEPVSRLDKDLPTPWVVKLAGFSVVPLCFVFYMVSGDALISVVMALVMLVAGFLFSAVASYMAGLVGSSNNPVSGVTIATLLFSSLMLFFLGLDGAAGPASAIMIGAVVCCAAAIGGDNIQDLKSGSILGATPWKQQVMQVIGVLSASLVMAPVLSLLHSAYGIVEAAGPDREPLAAPQATLMASVAKGVFERNLPWSIVVTGMLLAMVVIFLDRLLEKRGSKFRMPVLAVAVGIYLPLELETAILAGGLVSYFLADRWARAIQLRVEKGDGGFMERKRSLAERSGLLFAAGLITGEAVLGILLAIPIVLNQGINPLLLTGADGPLPPIIRNHLPSVWPGFLLFLGVIWVLHALAGVGGDSERRDK